MPGRLSSGGIGAARSPVFVVLIATLILHGCQWPTSPPPTEPTDMRPQSVVLFSTPKILQNFSDPKAEVAAFLDHYEPLTSRAAETIVIFAVGNSDHILQYRGADYWDDSIEWARYIDDWEPMSEQTMNYHQLAAIVRAFKAHAAARNIDLKVFDQIDKGAEFARNYWKHFQHPECYDFEWLSYNIRGRLRAESAVYASAPNGVQEGKSCGELLVDQAAVYMEDLGFDGILYGNQLGTRGHWLPENGPGFSEEEAQGIRNFLQYSQEIYGDKDLMWFDSYNDVNVERETFSFPSDGYEHFDYLIVSGFCVVTFPGRYIENLESKLELNVPTRILATLDYVDPWYTYDSMTEFPEESARLEEIAIENRNEIDGIVFFANDEWGAPVPRAVIESFAERFFEE